MSQQGSWLHGLFDCFSPMNTCCLAFWCPCVLYSKTKARKDGDPNVSACNGSCMAWAGLCMCLGPAQALLQMTQRGAIRRKYGINEQSNGCKDFCLSWCCGCCTLIQEDKEVRARESGVPQVREGYVAPNGGQGMVYQPAPAPAQGYGQETAYGGAPAHGQQTAYTDAPAHGHGDQKVGVV